ncbi:SusC/RagA family TonB-linked outer membrane protein [Mucilaginibacter corticis]|nr:SusC/RagA family TonB-linked outer membrane protein [Mucilaginibacter corticis]
MKLTNLIMILAIMQVSAITRAQKVTIAVKNAQLATVLQQIRAQTSYDFVYKTKTLENALPVTINASNQDLKKVLDEIFKNQPISYSIEDNLVVFKPKELSPLTQLKEKIVSMLDFNKDIKGRVSDSTNLLLPGASITLKNANYTRTALSDNNGYFEIPAVPDGNYTLTVTFVGYEKYQIPLNTKAFEGSLSIVLAKATSPLDQVQVIAYGNNTKRFSVGSVATVTSETIEKQPVTNVLLALEGQVPGLMVTPTGGAPGSAVKLQIRGQNSLRPTSSQFAPRPYDQPLFIVDGVPFATQNQSVGNLLTYYLTGNQQSVIPGNGVSALGIIDPADIESISVLKDADATSIYGSQGANGVILITTKKGKPGKAQMAVNVNSGFNAPTRSLQMMNTAQFLSLRREALAVDKVTLTPSNANTYPDLQLFDASRSVNWYNRFLDRTPFNTDVHASFSGGEKNTTFILSGGYNHTTYNFPGDFADNRLTLHSAYTYHSTNNKLSVQFGADYAYDKNNASAAPSVAAAMALVPNFPEMVDPQGNLIWSYRNYHFSNLNQYSKLRQPASVQMYNLNNTARLAYQIIPNLSISTNIGYSRTDNKNYAAMPKNTLDPFTTYLQSSATFTNSSYQAINIEPQATYEHQLGSGVLSALIGGTYKKQFSNSNTLTGSNYPNDDLLNSVGGAANIYAYDSNSIYKYTAIYARIGYLYDQKYIINLTGRRDGSSNFGPAHQFGNFGSIGLGWIFSEESSVKSNLPFLSFGKLSANYGTNGTDGVAPYSYQAFYDVAYPTQYDTYQGARPFLPSNLYNPNYSWSIKKSYNVAVDLGFFGDRLLFNATGYLNRTSDELINYALPTQTGFPGVLGNFPATLQNKGLEFTINSTNIKTSNFKWNSTFNIGLNKNTLAAFPGLATSSYSQLYQIGKSPNLFYGYRYKGVNPTTGLFEFYKADGTVTSKPTQSNVAAGGDQQPLFDLDPKFSGGFGNTITYKNFSLTVYCQFASQMANNYLAGIYSYASPGSFNNLPTAVIGKYWQKPGDNAIMQRLIGTYGNGQSTTAATAFLQSSGAYSNDTYLRVKTVSLSYSFPEHLLKGTGIKNLRVYVNAQNLFTITNYKLGDPEQPGMLYTIPLQRNIVGGLSFNFQ